MSELAESVTNNNRVTTDENISKLVNCPACEKKISSKAPTCPQCGHPTANALEESKSSKAGLGVFFIILGVVGILGGFMVSGETPREELQKKLIKIETDSVNENYRLAASPEFRSDLDSRELFQSGARRHQDDRRAEESKLSDLRSERHAKMAFWFVPGGVLFVLGLVLRTSRNTGIGQPVVQVLIISLLTSCCLVGCSKKTLSGVFAKKGDSESTYDFRNDGTVLHHSQVDLSAFDRQKFGIIIGNGTYVIHGNQVIADTIQKGEGFYGDMPNRSAQYSFEKDGDDLLLVSVKHGDHPLEKVKPPERYVSHR